jgi:NADH-quinone oxidoreductase subunit D
MEFYERVSGARMHAAFYRPNEVNLSHISEDFLLDVMAFSKNCSKTLNEMHNVLTYNKVWKQRLVGVGAYSYKTCLEYGLTGVMARCTGLKRDIRLDGAETYANYYYTNFRGFIGQKGDSYDRFLIRMNEMTESINIINQVTKVIMLSGKVEKNSKIDGSEVKHKLLSHELLKFINPHKVNSDNFKNNYNTMETLIDHFKY